MNCTHLVLYVQNIDATRRFYIERLGCILRRFSSEENSLSINVGDFIVNFYGTSANKLAEGYSQGVAHVGLEVKTRDAVDFFAKHFQSSAGFDDRRNAVHGPYRFYIRDPDGYTLEIHSWEGVEE